MKLEDVFQFDAAELLSQVIAWREYLHSNPELSHQETLTSEYIYQQLALLDNLEVTRPAATGVVARLKGGFAGKTIALRADIDALPIEEKNETAYCSVNKGVMHACGHDIHSAMLLGAAKILSKHAKQIKGEIVFIFQRGEEMSPGGAKELVDLGVLAGVDMFFALHVLPELPCGVFRLTKGSATANRDTFHITITGKGGHSSMPHLAADPIVCGAAVVLGLQTIVAREVDPKELAVISVCSSIAGDGSTAGIPAKAQLCGTNRTFTKEVREQIKLAMTRVVTNICAAHRCVGEIDFDSWDYSSIVNDDELCDISQNVITQLFGSEHFLLAKSPMFVGEDFSEYQAIAPVCFAWLGVARDNCENPPLHNAKFNPDEKAFMYGVKYYLGLVKQLLI